KVPHDHSDARHRRQPRAQETRAAVHRYVSGDDAALQRASGQRRRDCRRADVFPGPQSWTDRRAPADGPGAGVLMSTATARSIWDPAIVRTAIADSFRKLHPRTMAKNPVMFVVEVGSVLTTVALLRDAALGRPGIGFELQITFWLWLTVLFANFAEAMAEGRGKAQADTLRRARTETVATRIVPGAGRDPSDPPTEIVPAAKLRKDDVVIVKAGEFIPADGEIIEGVASVDESAITGESAPVIRESGGDRSAVTGGTRVISHWLKIRATSPSGHPLLRPVVAPRA